MMTYTVGSVDAVDGHVAGLFDGAVVEYIGSRTGIGSGVDSAAEDVSVLIIRVPRTVVLSLC
jgi:hypothetical protein